MKPEERLSLLRTEIWIKSNRELNPAEKQRMLKELREITEEIQKRNDQGD